MTDHRGTDMDLQINHISFSYTHAPVLRDVSFSVPHREFLGILGPNGSGKSTLLRLLIGALQPSEGKILLDGQEISTFSRGDLARRIAYVPQEGSWVFPIPVREVVLMGRAPFTGTLGFESKADQMIADEAMEMVDIASLADQPINAISGGERQRTLLARALAQQPHVVVLDEPNIHLDLSHQIEIFKILRSQNLERGLSVICVSHDVNLASAFCNTILFLARHNGSGSTVYALGSPNEVVTDAHLEAVFSTHVMVDRHPRSGRPRITLDPENRS